MCGIFGLSLGKGLSTNEINDVSKDINNFVDLSIVRGSDTFGININYDNNNYVYKTNSNPKKAIKQLSYKNFIQQHLLNATKQKNFFNYFGQTRLVTNGTKFLYKNNQPITLNRISGLHNGIIFFDEEHKINENHKQNYESFEMKSDSLNFFEKLENQTEENGLSSTENFINLVNEIEGNFSIAFSDLKDQVILISSNCGSLYYFYDKFTKSLIYASEKAGKVVSLESTQFRNYWFSPKNKLGYYRIKNKY